MIIKIVENDTPRDVKTKLAEYVARPPQPILHFYGEHSWEGNTFKFSVRNGLPVPLMYGIYANSDGDYRETTDHIGPFSVDNWRLTLDTRGPAQVELRLGLVPLEILTDRVLIAIKGG